MRDKQARSDLRAIKVLSCYLKEQFSVTGNYTFLQRTKLDLVFS